MTVTPFITQTRHYEKNLQEVLRTRVLPARITHPEGHQDMGVVIVSGWWVKLALTDEQAFGLANAIADTLEHNRTQNAQQPGAPTEKAAGTDTRNRNGRTVPRG